MPKMTERTSFTRDIQGRYLCNDINEVNAWKTQGGRTFDIIVIGGGTFGGAISEHLWYRQRQSGGGLRTLVVEAGLFTVSEHVQNTGIQGFDDGFNAFLLNENAPQPEPPRREVWGVPWKSDIALRGWPTPSGGPSLFWFGWSPRLLDAEMPATWPAPNVADLKARYFDEATRQIAIAETNDFIFGELQNALRRQLFDKIGAISEAIPLGSLPASPLLRPWPWAPLRARGWPWRRFLVRRGALEAHPGTDLGLLWLNRPTPPRYVLRLQWMMTAPDDNSGVFVAFPHPEQENYDNTAWVGVNFGFEIQIGEQARPDGADIHRTGAIYSFKGATDGPLNVRSVGEWNDYEITVDGTDFTSPSTGRR